MAAEKKPSSLRNAGGVAEILENARKTMREKLQTKLAERIEQGRSNLAESEVETISRLAAVIAGEVCADSISEAYQLGVAAGRKDAGS